MSVVTVPPEPQSAGAVLMVRPAHFAFNPQTAPSNAFQSAPVEVSSNGDSDAQRAALGEFDALATRLGQAGVEVIVGMDTPSPVKPDAIFPNNWVSFHRDGAVVLYPMLASNRRLERRDDLLQQVAHGGYRVERTVDLSHRESDGQFLEGTGSLVLDRPARVAYASLSPRTDLDVLGEFAQLLDYELVTFEARDGAGQPVYHTNVVMAIGSRFAVVCGEAIAQPAHRDAVFDRLRAAGHLIVDISLHQMLEFAANVLELASPDGPVIALSARAWQSLEPAQKKILESCAAVVPVEIPTIERIGGGGVRCMLAELHLPKRR